MSASVKPLSSFLPITSIQPQCYQALTDTFAQRHASISFSLCGFRTLLLSIGGGTPLPFLPPTVNAFRFSCLYSIAPSPKQASAGTSTLRRRESVSWHRIDLALGRRSHPPRTRSHQNSGNPPIHRGPLPSATRHRNLSGQPSRSASLGVPNPSITFSELRTPNGAETKFPAWALPSRITRSSLSPLF